MNTSLAITALYSALKANVSGKTKLALIADYDKVLDLNLLAAAKKYKEDQEKAKENEETSFEEETDPFIREIKEQIALRAKAKKEKNYALADEIRANLEARGVILTDTAAGTKFTVK